MAFKVIEESYCPSLGKDRCVIVLDSAEDVADLPKCCTGSVAIVADKGGAVYMVNTAGEWREL